jgi:hypothetical protein
VQPWLRFSDVRIQVDKTEIAVCNFMARAYEDMDVDRLFELAKPYLEKNDFGMAHTKRVFDIARENFVVPSELEELTSYSIILHDIGGGSIKNQYEKGPGIAAARLWALTMTILTTLPCPFGFCTIQINWLCFLAKSSPTTILRQDLIGKKSWI